MLCIKLLPGVTNIFLFSLLTLNATGAKVSLLSGGRLTLSQFSGFQTSPMVGRQSGSPQLPLFFQIEVWWCRMQGEISCLCADTAQACHRCRCNQQARSFCCWPHPCISPKLNSTVFFLLPSDTKWDEDFNYGETSGHFFSVQIPPDTSWADWCCCGCCCCRLWVPAHHRTVSCRLSFHHRRHDH